MVSPSPAQKTNCMVFHQTPSYAVQPYLKLYRNRIPVKEHIKFLGMHWDSQLNWNYHINQLKASCNKGLNLLRTLSSNTVGADQHVLLQTYRLIIRPKLDYACNIYGSAATATLRQLDAVHNDALRICTGAFKSSPTESLYALCHEPSLSDRRDNLICRYYYKLKSFLANPARSSMHNEELILFFSSRRYEKTPIIGRTNQILNELSLPKGPVLPYKTSRLYSWEMLCPIIDTSFAIANIKQIYDFSPTFNNYVHEQYQEFRHIYTDGSKTDSGVGAAAISNTTRKIATLPHIATVFTAEIHAMQLGCQIIKDQQNADGCDKFLICSDSLSVVSSLMSPNQGNEAMRRLQASIHEILIKNITIVVLWIPGHSNIYGNDCADNAAREASSRLPTFYPIPYTDFYEPIKAAINARWQIRWSNIGNHLHSIKNAIKPWNKVQLTRKQSVILNRLRLGHTLLTHSYLMDNNIPIRPPCRWCGNASLTISHIFISCVSLEQQRRFCFSSLKPPLTLSSIHGDKCNFSNISVFLELMGVYNEI